MKTVCRLYDIIEDDQIILSVEFDPTNNNVFILDAENNTIQMNLKTAEALRKVLLSMCYSNKVEENE